MIYTLTTLVDITETKQHHGGESISRYQQQNFETVLHTIGLCGNVYYTKSPMTIPATDFKLKNKLAWYFEWQMEIEELFTKDNNPTAILDEIFNFVPIITGLTETVTLDKPMFIVNKNIIFNFK